jgi:cyclase
MGPMMASIPIEAVELAAGFHLIRGPGGNIAVLGGPDGLIVVDSSVPMRANEVLEMVKRVGGKPVRG